MNVSVAASEGEGQPQAAESQRAPVAPTQRISSLDFIRGLAVMGILVANIVAFGQPPSAYFFPESFLIDPGDPGGFQWIAQFVLIDGKMRGLFTLLFGAGMYLFMERAWSRGSSRWLQMWRLFLLLGFGLLHFYLIWFGDILSMYAMLGFVAVAFMRLQASTQIRTGLFIYTLGCIFLGGMFLVQYLIVETDFGASEAMAETRQEIVASFEKQLTDQAKVGVHVKSGDYAAMIAERFKQQWFFPFLNPVFFIFESLSLMLIGMGLYRQGFFNGGFTLSKMKMWGWIGVLVGGALTLALGLWVKQEGFSYMGVNAAFSAGSMAPRLMMTLGLAALLVEYSKTANGWLAERVSAAGRAAFTNYLGTSIVMMIVFQGWGLGLFGQLNRPMLYLVALLTCLLMLAWSKPWLDSYRYGPLEWLWRCLTYRRLFPLKR